MILSPFLLLGFLLTMPVYFVEPFVARRVQSRMSLFSEGCSSSYSDDVCKVVRVPSEEFPSISWAVRKIRPPESCPLRIEVEPGLYEEENIRVEKWVEIVGKGDVCVRGSLTLTKQATGSSVVGLTFVKPNKRDRRYSTVRIEAANFTLANCTVQGGTIGVYVGGNWNVKGEIRDCLIRESLDGIYVEGAASPMIQDNVIEDTHVGIRCGRWGCPHLVQNTVRRAQKHGIAASQRSCPEITNNLIEECKEYGIYVACTAEATISQRAETYINCQKGDLSYNCG